MIPLFGEIASKDKFDQIIANEAGVAIEDIISTDLFCIIENGEQYGVQIMNLCQLQDWMM